MEGSALPTTLPTPQLQHTSHPVPFYDPCANLSVVPYADIMSSGLDLAGDEVKGQIFDNHFFDTCRKTIDTGTGHTFRMPSNLDNVRYKVDADGDLQVNSYVSNYDYARATSE